MTRLKKIYDAWYRISRKGKRARNRYNHSAKAQACQQRYRLRRRARRTS